MDFDSEVTHRPKGRMCLVCKGLDENYTCPKLNDFKTMIPIDKDPDGVIVVKCTKFKREIK